MSLMSNKKALAKWLKTEREKRGWSQYKLGKKAGLNRSVIWKTEEEANDPNPLTLKALAKALEYPLDQLYRLIGYWDSVSEIDELTQRIVVVTGSLPEEKKKEILRHALYVSQSEE